MESGASVSSNGAALVGIPVILMSDSS